MRPATLTTTKGPSNGGRVIRRAIPYFWPKDDKATRVRVVVALVFLGLAKALTAATPLIYGATVDAFEVNPQEPVWYLAIGAIGLTVAYGMARLMSNGFQQLRDVVFAPVSNAALRSLGLEVFRHIHNLSMRYHISRKTGGLSRIMERGVKGVSFLLRFLVFSIGPLFLELFMVLAIVGAKLGFSYLAVLVVVFAVYIIFTLKVTEWRVKIRKEMNDLDTDANQKAIDSLLNFETVKYFVAEEREAARYDVAMRGYEAASIKTETSLAFLNFGQSLILTTGLVTSMILAALQVQAGEITIGDFVMINAFVIQITMPLNFLGSMYRNIRQALVDMEEMFSLLYQPAEIKDAENAPDLAVKGGRIHFEDVDFAYDAARPILHKLSLDIPAGKTVAIVGPSGSGKSTIGRLLFRFYEVTGGALKIDNQDLRDVTQESVHKAIGVVPQDTVLFNDSIRYNIGYGRGDASFDEIVAAAKQARIHDFIESLPDGYETEVGERGLKLSGGEKQRVGIARTLLKNPPIILLDEATSALDTQTERDILDALREAGRGRTVLTIAHRLSTVSDADEIVVLDKGVVLERGTHDELLERKGKYAAMWSAQAEESDFAA